MRRVLLLTLLLLVVPSSSNVNERNKGNEIEEKETKKMIVNEDNVGDKYSLVDKEVEVPLLPTPEEGTSSRTLSLGETMALDDLGPIIINNDGTMRRIANWLDMTNDERKHTIRKVSIRNKKRLNVLKNKERLEIIEKYYEEQKRQRESDELEYDESFREASSAEDEL